MDPALFRSPGAAVAPPPRPAPRDRVWLHVLLFAATFITTAYAGAQFAGRIGAYFDGPIELLTDGTLLSSVGFWLDGFRFAGALLLFLTVHEFGHYFAARYHRIGASLPYYIPLPLGIGTLGAVIRIREPIPDTNRLFDIGAAGPLAGFVAALLILGYAFATLPPPEYLLDVPGHEALKAYIESNGAFPPHMLGGADEGGLLLIPGQTPLYWALSQLVPDAPPMYEMIHYPVLFGAWLGLLFTAINLLPVGQLDGGHVLYALVGPRRHRWLARTFVLLLLASGSVGVVSEVMPVLAERGPLWEPGSWFALAAILYYFLHHVFRGAQRWIAPLLLGLVTLAVVAPTLGLDRWGYTGWLFWTFLIVKLIKVEHPPVAIRTPLSPKRKMLAWACIVIFVLCFSPIPLRTTL